MQGHAERLKQWVSMGFGLLILAIILHFTDGEHFHLSGVTTSLYKYLILPLKFNLDLYIGPQPFLSTSNCTALATSVSRLGQLESYFQHFTYWYVMYQ